MYLTPVVIEQTSRGERSFDIYSRLLQDRIILIFGEINETISASVIAQILVKCFVFFLIFSPPLSLIVSVKHLHNNK